MGRYVKTYTDDKRRYLLSPVSVPPPAIDLIYSHPSAVPFHIWKHFQTAPLVALDFEATGLKVVEDTDFRVVGVGLSTGDKTIYIDLGSCSRDEIKKTLARIKDTPLIAHNIMYDGSVWKHYMGTHANWQYCTYALFRQLSSESRLLSWGLKQAQTELLGWENSNEPELDNWLIDNGYVKSNVYKEQKPGSYPIQHSKGLRYVKPDKGEMWRAPRSILGHYCALDAFSTWALFTHVLKPGMERFKEVMEPYHKLDFIYNVKALIDNYLRGITIDRPRLEKYETHLTTLSEQLWAKFITDVNVSEGIKQFNHDRAKEHQQQEPDKWKKAKLPKRPKRKYKLDGEISKTWLIYEERMQQYKEWRTNPDNISKNWLKWKDKNDRIRNGKEEKISFNPGSDDHLRWLLYTHLDYPVKVWTEPKEGSDAVPQPAVSDSAFQGMGQHGKMIMDWKEKEKLLRDVRSLLDKLVLHTSVIPPSEAGEGASTEANASESEWRFHPLVRAPGTLSGRLSGTGGFNIQNITKDYGYLSCWRPTTPGKVFFDCDWKALEMVVTTELSRCPGLLSIYGPDAKANDVYLFLAAQISGLGQPLLDAGYNPYNPNPEALKYCKKNYKNLRAIGKKTVLSKNYGAGAQKIYDDLILQGVDITFEQAKAACNTFDNVFSGRTELIRQLEREWKENGGFILNGFGRPMPIAERYLKDSLNRLCQSTGHDCHMKVVRIMEQMREAGELKYDWVIVDFHDQFIVELDEDYMPEFERKLQDVVLRVLNEELGGLLPIEGDPQYIPSIAEAKLEPEDIQKGKEEEPLWT